MTCNAPLPASRKRWKRLLIVNALAGALIISAALFYKRPSPESVHVQFAGFTNYPGRSYPTALFAVTNVSKRTLQFWETREVKTSDWPVYGPNMARRSMLHPTLLPHAGFTCAVSVPEYGTAWRVRFSYTDTLTKWGTNRARWANSLHVRRMHGLAQLISPATPAREIVTAEMEPADWQKPRKSP
jgi:hypothetical protein